MMVLTLMLCIQIQFSEQQIKLLKDSANREQVSIADIVRRAVDAWCRADRQVSVEERRQAALAIVGQFASGQGDVARRHDDYLVEAFRE